MGIDSPLDSFSVSLNKRLKTVDSNSSGEFNLFESHDGGVIDSRRKQSESEDDSEASICGICLCDNENAVRGKIDSCDHFFCFVCIMEWAKVESRCPMCKRRFTAIHRSPKPGVFPSERLVHVVQRDQVYHLNGNTSIANFDPYAQIQCTACNSSTDESLLLLCDLCDSAAHTYCVGLGSTVPEGDWFCHDCVVSKTEHENIQKEEELEDANQNTCRKSSELKAAACDAVIRDKNTSDDSNFIAVDQEVSIFDIVCNSEWRPNLLREMNMPGERAQTRHRKTPLSNSEKITQNGARTLRRCRNVRSYVQALRDNWNSLQNGSLRFSSTSASCSSSIQNCNTVAVTGQQNSLSSENGEKGMKNGCVDETPARNRCSYDVDKAWKMMDKAKSVKQACLRTNSVHGVSKQPSREGTTTRKATDGSSIQHLSRRLHADRELRTSSMCSLRKETDEHLSSKWIMQTQSSNICKAIPSFRDNRLNSLAGLSTPASKSESLSVSTSKIQTSRASNVCLENLESSTLKSSVSSSQNVTDKQDGSGSSAPPVLLVPKASESLNSNANLGAVSSSRPDGPNEDGKTETGCSGSDKGKHEDAKSEILLLVKLNLKLLNGQKQLGKDGYKEVARVATHTVMAACGYGDSKHVFQSIPRCVCNHSEKLHKSTLMSNVCRECFYVFVKDVVCSVLSHKLSKSAAT